jgi:hypothetical protein
MCVSFSSNWEININEILLYRPEIGNYQTYTRHAFSRELDNTYYQFLVGKRLTRNTITIFHSG